MMDTFVGPQHRIVFWLATPTLGTHAMNSAAIEIDKVVKAEAEKRSKDVVYVDTYKLFADPNGDYARQIVDDQGQTITARISDGVHFSVKARRIPRAVRPPRHALALREPARQGPADRVHDCRRQR